MTDPQLQQKRLAAAAIDVAILIAFAVVMAILNLLLTCGGHRLTGLGFLAPVLWVGYSVGALFYVLGRDVLAGTGSLGKKAMGIRVLTATGQAPGALESAKRNLLFAPPFIFSAVSAIIGVIPAMNCLVCLLWPLYVIAIVFAIAIGIWEIVQIVTQPEGVRLGDQMANTRVGY